MFSIVRTEYLAWHGVGLNRGFARTGVEEGGEGESEIGDEFVRDQATKNPRSLLCIRHAGGRFC